MEDKEKEIKEIETIIKSNLAEGSFANAFARKVAIQIVEYYQPKISEDSVVIPKKEMERLSSSHNIVFCDNKDCPDNLLCRCCEISECPKNIPEYNEKLSVNKYKLELFQKLCKERERADSWEDRCKLLEEELKQERNENKRLFYRNSNLILENKNLKEDLDVEVLKGKEIAEKILNDIYNKCENDMWSLRGYAVREGFAKGTKSAYTTIQTRCKKLAKQLDVEIKE